LERIVALLCYKNVMDAHTKYASKSIIIINIIEKNLKI
jgi:hypothetical protein